MKWWTSNTNKILCLQPHFVSVYLFSWGFQHRSLRVWKVDCGLFDETIFFSFNKATASSKKKFVPSKKTWKRRLIYNHIRPRDEFLLTHCWREMFDLQSGDKVLCVSREEKSKINVEHISHDSFLRLNQSAAISSNNYVQSRLALLLQAIIRCIRKQWKAPCGNWLSSFFSLTLFKNKQNVLINPVN